jgi:amino acid transporter
MNHSKPSDKTHNLVRELGLSQAIAIGLGTMVGAGIFVLSALAAERAGPASAISYLIAGAICCLIALVISELATGMPKAGGSYTFITEALMPSQAEPLENLRNQMTALDDLIAQRSFRARPGLEALWADVMDLVVPLTAQSTITATQAASPLPTPTATP